VPVAPRALQDDYKPISAQQIGSEEILCYVQVRCNRKQTPKHTPPLPRVSFLLFSCSPRLAHCSSERGSEAANTRPCVADGWMDGCVFGLVCVCTQVSDINTTNINDQTYDEVDDELRATAWYKELERQMEEERVRRVAAEEERARRQAEAEAKALAEAEAKAAKKGGKKKKKK
jgi:hypothetical protein